MEVVLHHLGRVLVAMGPEDLETIKQALAAQSSPASARALLEQLAVAVAAAPSAPALVDARADGGSVQVRVISVWGDPMDWSSVEARGFAERVLRAASDAE